MFVCHTCHSVPRLVQVESPVPVFETQEDFVYAGVLRDNHIDEPFEIAFKFIETMIDACEPFLYPIPSPVDFFLYCICSRINLYTYQLLE